MPRIQLDDIDLAQRVADRAEEYANRVWDYEAKKVSPTADVMRKSLFIRLWKTYTAKLLATGSRDLFSGNEMERILYQTKDDFVDMAQDLPQQDAPAPTDDVRFLISHLI